MTEENKPDKLSTGPADFSPPGEEMLMIHVSCQKSAWRSIGPVHAHVAREIVRRYMALPALETALANLINSAFSAQMTLEEHDCSVERLQDSIDSARVVLNEGEEKSCQKD
jgi:hypothetical protein